jgi:hypothetical protein
MRRRNPSADSGAGPGLRVASQSSACRKSDREPAKVRSHGSRHEGVVPLLVHGRKIDIDQYKYNMDLTRKLDWEAGRV